MKNFKKLLAVSLILSSVTSFAKLNRTMGEWGSGGGNALVCFKKVVIADGGETTDVVTEIKKNNNTIPDKFLPYIESIEVFDLYEAKKRRGLDSKKPEILTIRDDEKIYEYFDRMGNRFKNRLYIMEYMIEAGKKLIPDTQLIFHDFAVKYQNDLGSVTLPNSNCIISTMAAQVNYHDFYEVHIDERLFNHPKHSKQSKATLVLHELIYALARKHFDHKDSGATRNVLRYFISYHETFTEGTIAKALSDLDFMAKEMRVSNKVDKALYSNIMAIIQGKMFSTQANMNTLVNFRFTATDNTLLFEEVKAKIKEENLADISEFQNNFIGEDKLIHIGLANSSHLSEWTAIFKRFSMITDDLINELESHVLEVKKENLAYIKSESFITIEDYNNLSIRFDSLLDNYFRGTIYWITEVIEERKDWAKFTELIFQEMLLGTICTSSTSSGPVVVNPVPPTNNKSDQQCYGPLKLDNIIPRA